MLTHCYPLKITLRGRMGTRYMENNLGNVYLASLVAQLVRNPPAMWEIGIGKIPCRKERLPIPVFWPREFHGLYSQ